MGTASHFFFLGSYLSLEDWTISKFSPSSNITRFRIYYSSFFCYCFVFSCNSPNISQIEVIPQNSKHFPS